MNGQFSFNLFDVRHGFCAYAQAPNGSVTLFDCGHDDQTGFRPSVYLPKIGIATIDRFVVGNFDNDHVSDLSNLQSKVYIRTFFRNRSIDEPTLRRLKLQNGPLSPGLTAVLQMHQTYIHPITPVDYGGVGLETFWVKYPTFTDTNNLSVVSFVDYGPVHIVIPGDLERAGWRELLKDPDFMARLRSVNIFVASHHGRESGYCEDVFNFCYPDVILISDKEIVHDTQDNEYAKHASGILWNGSNMDRRYVLTTRCDGHMCITTQGRGYHIQVG